MTVSSSILLIMNIISAARSRMATIYEDLEKFAFFSKAAALRTSGDRLPVRILSTAMTGRQVWFLFTSRTVSMQDEFFRGYEVHYDHPQPEIPGRMGCKDDSGALPDLPIIILHRISWRHTRMAICLKGGIVFADAVTTVSNTYAEEIKTPFYGEGLDGLLRAQVQQPARYCKRY